MSQNPHNDTLLIISESGMAGFIIILIFVIIHLKILIKSIKSNNTPENNLLYLFILMVLTALFMESMFDFPKQRIMPNLYFWVLMGFISTLSVTSGTIKKAEILRFLPCLIFFIVSIFSFMDMQANKYNQNMRYLKDHRQYEPAISQGKKSLSYLKNVDNTGTPTYFYLGIVEYQTGNMTGAKDYFIKSLELSPYHLGALENYMIVLGKLGKCDEAQNIMDKLQEIYPNYYRPLIMMAKLYLLNNDKFQAGILLDSLKVELNNQEKKIFNRESLIEEADKLYLMTNSTQKY
jgi:hypothetical protein